MEGDRPEEGADGESARDGDRAPTGELIATGDRTAELAPAADAAPPAEPGSAPYAAPTAEPAPAAEAAPIAAAEPATAAESAPIPAAEPAPAAEPLPPPPPPPPPAPPIPLASTRGLLGASFDLLARSGPAMRRASFYIGLVALGTVGPWVVAQNLIVAAFESVDVEAADFDTLVRMADTNGPSALLGFLALAGLLVAAVESRTLAAAVLGGRVAGRAISTRQALARSRRSFWRAVVASVVVAVPITFAQGVVTTVLEPFLGLASAEIAVIPSTLVSALVGAPFAYALSGVVLGDVDAFEAVRRSWLVFRARPWAAVVIALFESVTILLVLVGLLSGVDIAFRLFGIVEPVLGREAVGLAVTSLGFLALVFAFGTLLFTVTAITIAPQVVMFVGLTHATIGLDRLGDAARDGAGRVASRWISLPMLAGFGLGLLGLGLTITVLSR